MNDQAVPITSGPNIHNIKLTQLALKGGKPSLLFCVDPDPSTPLELGHRSKATVELRVSRLEARLGTETEFQMDEGVELFPDEWVVEGTIIDCRPKEKIEGFLAEENCVVHITFRISDSLGMMSKAS